ncbi:MAG TPA: PhnD/SsuA/transferrin family substrate-binding protein [candidate division Zixibacteria bacterium]|nr:PhnD/SsuA/transferrin family substrate-binding protein [candidate division Zixibacteria bacterium]
MLPGRLRRWGAAALVAAVFTSGPASGAELPAVEVGLPQDGLFGLGGQYIIDHGLDRRNGFVMKPRWAGVPEIQRLLGIQAISVGLMTPEAGLRANLAGVPMRLIQPYQTSHMFVLVRSNSPYRSVEDLKGKPVALTPEVTTLYNLFDFIMRKKGASIEKDFQLKKLGGPGIIAVLEKGDVEAGLIWEAHVSRLVTTGKYRTIMSLRDEMNRLLSTKILPVVWLGALEPWVRANGALVASLRAAWTEAYRGVQKDEGHFKKYAKRFFGLERAEDLGPAWQRTRAFLLPEEFKWPEAATLKAMQTFLREGTALGMFPKEAESHIEPLFTP